MPLCAKCKDFFPPDFMVDLDGKVQQCLFCKKETKVLTFTKKNGIIKKYTKQECIDDYKKLTRMIVDKPGMKDKILGKR